MVRKTSKASPPSRAKASNAGGAGRTSKRPKAPNSARKGARKFTAKQAAAVAAGAEDFPTAKKVWAAMKSGVSAGGALGLAQERWVKRQERTVQDAKALLTNRKRIKAKVGERRYLRQVIGRLAKPARDMTERPLYTNIVDSNGGTPIKLAFAKGATPVKAKLVKKDGQVDAGNASLTARAGKDYIVRQADGQGAPWVVDRDLFEASYQSTGKGRFAKNTCIPYGYIVADRSHVFYMKEGPIRVAKGDVILIGTRGEAWGMKPDKFAARYSTGLPKSGVKRATSSSRGTAAKRAAPVARSRARPVRAKRSRIA